MTLIEQVKELTALHQYWHSVGTPESQAVADRIVGLMNVLLNTANS